MNTIMFCVIVFDTTTWYIKNNIWCIYLFYVMGVKMYEAFLYKKASYIRYFMLREWGYMKLFITKLHILTILMTFYLIDNVVILYFLPVYTASSKA